MKRWAYRLCGIGYVVGVLAWVAMLCMPLWSAR